MRSVRALDAALANLRAGVPGGLVGLALLLVALVALFAATVPGFASAGAVQSIMFQMPELGLLSLAMLIPLISGGLNLAVIATANQAALLMATVMKLCVIAGAPVPVAVLGAMVCGLALCLAIGAVTGALVAYTGVHPILVTLGTRSLIDGVSIYLTRGTVISGLPPGYSAAGNALVGGVPVPFLVLVLAALAVTLALRRTAWGQRVFMVGSNIAAARYSGTDTGRVLVGVYVASSVLCFVAGCLTLARFNSASAGYAGSYLLVTILAAVLGGVDPFGGFGRVAGLMLALAILQVIASATNLLGFSDYLKLATWGLVLIGVMAAQTAAKRH